MEKNMEKQKQLQKFYWNKIEETTIYSYIFKESKAYLPP